MAEIYAEHVSFQAFPSVPPGRATPPKEYEETTHMETGANERVASLAERVRAYEIGLIREALARTRGNQSEAARLLGVPRRTLAHKVLTYGLARSRRAVRAREDDTSA
jgi:DNA-binding NtrC family response regulator